ncbi:MAG: malonyl-CoA O-methyltransferase, partial [Betaproteobacteria bacterium]
MTDELALDKRQLKRAFELAADKYDAAAVLQHEVCNRMLTRLDYIKVQPRTILDAGSGTGNAVTALLARYPQAALVALDLALAMLQRGRTRLRWWQGLPGLRPLLHPVC